MPDLLQQTLTFDVAGDTYVFAIPSLKDEMIIGIRERNLRLEIEREITGGGAVVTGMPTGDNGTDFLFRAVATIQAQLRAGPAWVWSPDEQSLPTIDYTKWPADRVNTVGQVLLQYEQEVRRFREGGPANGDADGGQAMAGQSGSGG